MCYTARQWWHKDATDQLGSRPLVGTNEHRNTMALAQWRVELEYPQPHPTLHVEETIQKQEYKGGVWIHG